MSIVPTLTSSLVSRTYGVVPVMIEAEGLTVRPNVTEVGMLGGSVEFGESPMRRGVVAIRTVFSESQAPAASTADFTVDVKGDGTFHVGYMPPGRYHVRWIPLSVGATDAMSSGALDIGDAGPVRAVEVIAGGGANVTIVTE